MDNIKQNDYFPEIYDVLNQDVLDPKPLLLIENQDVIDQEALQLTNNNEKKHFEDVYDLLEKQILQITNKLNIKIENHADSPCILGNLLVFNLALGTCLSCLKSLLA